MNKSTITREQAQKIIVAADEVITALAGTNEDVHPEDSKKMCELWDDLNDRYAPPVVVRELARMALAALDSEPVVFTDERNLHHIAMGRETSLIWGKQNSEAGAVPLYRHEQPGPAARMVVIPTIWKHYTAAKTATIYEKAMTDAGIEWRSIDD